jgi:hypothetical protein
MKPRIFITAAVPIVGGLASLFGYVGTLKATAIYDYSSTVTIDFNVPWVSVHRITKPSPFPAVGGAVTGRETSTTGEATAHAVLKQRADLLNYSYTEVARVTGSAGDMALLDSGMSFAKARLYNLFTFDFGAIPTDFTISLLAYDPQLLSSTDAPILHGYVTSNGTGEEVFGGSVGYQAILLKPNGDFAGISTHGLQPGQSITVPNLTGIHTFRFGVLADTQARAVYPYTVTVPEVGSAFLLMSLALVSCRVFRRLS